MLKDYKTSFKSLIKKMSKLTMKRGAAMLLAISIMLVAVPTIAITAIYAEGSTVGEPSGIETTVSDIDETVTTASIVETTTEATDDTTTTAETSTSVAEDESTTSSVLETTTTAEATTTLVADGDEMTTAQGITASTTAAVVPVVDYGGLKLAMVTSLPIGSHMDLYFTATGTVYIDWGDGSVVEYSDSGITVGSDIKVYCTGNMTGIICSGNQLSSIDISSCTELTKLHCSDNPLHNIDVTNNINLTDLSCGASAISGIDLSNNTQLEVFNICSSWLQSIDLSNCSKLKTLDISYNTIDAVDLNKNTELTYLNCSSNSLTELDVSNNSKITYVDCSENRLTFTKLLYIVNDLPALQTFNYYNQYEVSIPSEVDTGAEIDLSSEHIINGTKTVYTWYNEIYDSVVTPTTSENGVFTFDNDFAGMTLYCTMTNEQFPQITLTTTIIFIKGSTDLGEPQIVMTTALPIGSQMTIHIESNGYSYIDWGDGNMVPSTSYDYASINAGDTIKIYCSGDITYLYCCGNQLTALELSNATGLTDLYCEINQLTSLDLSNNTELVNLNCCFNQLEKLDISKNTALEQLDCFENLLTSLDVSKNSALVKLSLGCNKLTSLDLSNNAILTELAFPSNQLTSLDLSNNTALTWLSCSENKISSLDLSNNTALTNLYCMNNRLTELDLSNNTKLICLEFDNNQLEEIDVSNHSDLKYLSCFDNKFLFSTLPADSGKYLWPVHPDSELIPSYYYAPQAKVTISGAVMAYSDFADLSSEYDIDGTKTVYTWYDAANGSAVTPMTSENGVFTFGKDFVGKSLYCEMTNAKFPELTLTTTEVTVEESFEVVDNNDYIGEAEPSDDIVVEDENGNEINLGNVRLIIGNVAENNKNTVREAIETYNKEFKAADNNHAMYDIHLETDNGVKVEIVDGRIKIRLHYPDNLGAECTDYTYHLYHIKDDGTVEEIAIDAKPNGIWFYADDFSPYVLTYELKDTTTTTTTSSSTSATTTTSTKSTVAGSSDTNGKGPKTGDDSLSTVVAITLNLMLVMMLLIVLGFRWHQKFHQSTVVLTAGAEGSVDKTDSELLVDDDEISIK